MTRTFPPAGPFPDVQDVLPHRPPFLFVDRVLELDAQRVLACRTFQANEVFFAGHFPGKPVVPGVLLVEGLAQTMAYYARLSGSSERAFLVGIDRARFRATVEPGTEVLYEVKVGPERFGLRTAEGRVRVGELTVAEATLMAYAGESAKGPLG